jgi:hypothetical protein
LTLLYPINPFIRQAKAALEGQTALRRVYFSNCGNEGDAATLITDALLAIKNPSDITTFHIL